MNETMYFEFYWNVDRIFQESWPLTPALGFYLNSANLQRQQLHRWFLWMFDKHHPWNKPNCSRSKFYWQFSGDDTIHKWRVRVGLPLTATALLKEKGGSFPQHTHNLPLLALFSGVLHVYDVTLLDFGCCWHCESTGWEKVLVSNTAPQTCSGLTGALCAGASVCQGQGGSVGVWRT